jgi:hypothetical protein
MFIEAVTRRADLRQEGHVCITGLYSSLTDMALLPEGGHGSVFGL